MLASSVKGGLCRSFYIINKFLLSWFLIGRQDDGEKSQSKKELHLLGDAGKTPVVQSVRVSGSKTGSANTLNSRGFFFSGIFHFAHEFG
jgi:hypothetical protein